MDEWVTFMEEKIVPFISAKGMQVDAMFRGTDDPSNFIWIHHFDNEAHKKALYKAVYESDEWQSDFKPNVRRLVDVETAVVHVAHATQKSPLN